MMTKDDILDALDGELALAKKIHNKTGADLSIFTISIKFYVDFTDQREPDYSMMSRSCEVTGQK